MARNARVSFALWKRARRRLREELDGLRKDNEELREAAIDDRADWEKDGSLAGIPDGPPSPLARLGAREP